MEKIFLRIRGIAVEFPDGVTIGFGELVPIESGWVVPLKGAQNFEGREGMRKALRVAQETSQTISGWIDDEIEFWDVVMIFEEEDEATDAGKKNDQVLIYQIETGRIKWLI